MVGLQDSLSINVPTLNYRKSESVSDSRRIRRSHPFYTDELRVLVFKVQSPLSIVLKRSKVGKHCVRGYRNDFCVSFIKLVSLNRYECLTNFSFLKNRSALYLY